MIEPVVSVCTTGRTGLWSQDVIQTSDNRTLCRLSRLPPAGSASAARLQVAVAMETQDAAETARRVWADRRQTSADQLQGRLQPPCHDDVIGSVICPRQRTGIRYRVYLFVCLFVHSYVHVQLKLQTDFDQNFSVDRAPSGDEIFWFLDQRKGPPGGKIFNLLPTVVPREIEWPIHLGEVFFWLPTTSSNIRKRDHRGEHFGGRPNCVRSNRFTISDMVTWEILGVELTRPTRRSQHQNFQKTLKIFLFVLAFDFCCCWF